MFTWLTVNQNTGDAAIRKRDHRLLASKSAQLAKRGNLLVRIIELVADEFLGLCHVGRDHCRLGAHGELHRLAFGVDDRDYIEPLQFGDQRRVDRRIDSARQRAREHADCGSTRQVTELLDEQFHFGRVHFWPALVDLCLLAGRRIEHRDVRPGLLRNVHEPVEDRLGRQLLDDPGSRRAANKPCRDDRLAKRGEQSVERCSTVR